VKHDSAGSPSLFAFGVLPPKVGNVAEKVSWPSSFHFWKVTL
jgi:hypothetical protein